MTIADHPSVPAACQAAWGRPGIGAHPALEAGGDRLTYADLSRNVTQAAGALREAGVRRGDIVAVAMARSADCVVGLLAAIWAGACACPMEPGLSADETRLRLETVGTDWVIVDDAHATGIADLGWPRMRTIRLPAGSAAPYRDDGLGPNDRALLLFTSGSTGRPKGVVLTHRNILSNADGVAHHTGLEGGDRLLHVMPLHHTNALNNQIFAPFLVGAAVILGERFKADRIPGLLEQARPTIFTGVPTMYARLLQNPLPREGLKSLRMARCGSAPITEALHHRVEDRFGCSLIVSYGLSEATCTTLMNPPTARRIGTVGTVLRGQEVAILQPGGPEPVPGGQEGEIAIAGPGLMAGYLGADLQDSRMIADGWLRTGDLGQFDPDGYLSVTGRLKDVIIRGGENLSPQAIEKAIMNDPAIETCCVVGRAHHDLGQVPVAFVVPRSGRTTTPDRVKDAVGNQLSRVYRPEDVHIVEALPETEIGKLDRKRLADRALSLVRGRD